MSDGENPPISEDINDIKSTVNYVIAHNKEELMELLENLRKEVTEEENIDLVLKLEKLIEIFLNREFLEREYILSLINQLDNSTIEKSKQHRLKVLLSDIDKYHAHEEDDKRHVLQQLVRKDLSEDQFLRPRQLEKDLLDLPTTVEVIKEKRQRSAKE